MISGVRYDSVPVKGGVMDLPTFLIEALKVNGSVLSAWAWPVAILGCAVIFKREVRALLHRIKSLKGAGMEAAFEERLEFLEEAPRKRPQPDPDTTSNSDEGRERPSAGRQNGDAGVAPSPDVDASISHIGPDRPRVGEPHGPSPETSWDQWWHDYHNDAVVRNDAPTGAIIRYWRSVETAIRSLYGVALSNLESAEKHKHPPDHIMLRTLQDHGVVDEALVFRIQELRALRNLAVHDVAELSWDQVQRYKKQARYVHHALAYLHSQYAPSVDGPVEDGSNLPSAASAN